MASSTLLRQAQAEAYLRVAPQIAALHEAVAQSKADRDTAIHAAAAASHGIGRSINRAGPSIRRAFAGPKADAASSRSMVDASLPGLASAGPGGAVLSAAITRERGAGSARQASSQAQALSELSDRRIEAAAGRAYSTQRTLSDYASKSSTLSARGAGIAATQGAAADAAFGKLTQAEQDRQLKRDLQASSQAFTGGQNAANRKNARILSSQRIGASEHTAALGRRQKAIQGGRNRANARTIAGMHTTGIATTPGGAPKLTATEQKGRQAVQDVANQYNAGIAAGQKLHTIAQTGRDHGVHEAYLQAGAELATKGYISPKNVKALNDLGVSVPKDWTGVSVPGHTRKRPTRKP